MHPTGVASAVWVFASAPSKVPFYAAGGALAGWAVLLGAIGLTHPEFPGSPVRARMVMLASAALVAATITTAVVTAHTEGAGEATAGLKLTADPTGKLAFDKHQATVAAGKVSIDLVNRSSTPHDVTIAMGAKVVAQTKTIQGGTTTATANLAAGRYVFYCAVDGHRKAGMQGTLTVR